MYERFEEFTFAVYEIQRRWNKIASDGMEFYGLKGSYVVYILALNRVPEGLTAAGLGNICGRDKADVSRTLAVLESKNIIRKESGGGNIYRAKLYLTETGKALAEELAKKAEYAEAAVGKGLSDDDRAALYRSLEVIRNNLRELEAKGIPEDFDLEKTV